MPHASTPLAEPPDVVEPTLVAALNLRYRATRLHVHLLDDGKRPAMARLVRRLAFQCRHMQASQSVSVDRGGRNALCGGVVVWWLGGVASGVVAWRCRAPGAACLLLASWSDTALMSRVLLPCCSAPPTSHTWHGTK